MTLEDNQRDLLGLRRRRGVIKGSLTRIKTFVKDFNTNNQPMSLLEFRQDELPQINRKFDDVQSQIELLSDDTAQETDERNAFEMEYYSIRSQIQEIVNTQKSQNTSLISNQSVGAVQNFNRVRLPPITLPTFDGNIQEWASFFDCFKAMVHNEDTYPAAQKFSYLRSTLTGAALDVVRAIPMTEANYEVALKRLRQRYENKSMIIQSHIRAILDCPQMETATAGELQSLHSRVVSHTAALEAIGQPVEQWDAWLVTVILRKLDHATAQDWQLRREDTELPTYKQLEEYLASRCVALESTETFAIKGDLKKKSTTNYSLGKRVTLAAIETKSEKCACCSHMHKIYACKKFRDLSQGERFNVVRSARMCFNCLSTNHMAPKCQSNSKCQLCGGKHNTLLHFEKPTQGEPSETVNRRTTHEVESASSEHSGNEVTQAHSYLAARPKSSYVFLSTAEVLVTDSKGYKRKCRAVLDSGSMINFVSRSFSNALQLQTRKTELPIRGVGSSQVQSVAVVDIQVDSRVRKFQARLPFHVLPTVVSELPSCPMPKGGWDIPQNLISELADTKFYEAGEVDLLIGAELFYRILEKERILLNNNSQ